MLSRGHTRLRMPRTAGPGMGVGGFGGTARACCSSETRRRDARTYAGSATRSVCLCARLSAVRSVRTRRHLIFFSSISYDTTSQSCPVVSWGELLWRSAIEI